MPTVLHSRPLIQNAEKRVASFHPGVGNLDEKFLPVARIQPTLPILLPGTRNLAERIQIAPQHVLPGTRNLAEKAIPETVILKMSGMHPKNAYQSI